MPSKRGTRKTVAEGIYLDEIGYEVVVSVGSGATRRSKSKRYEKGTGLRVMTRWQDTMRGVLTKKKPKVNRGTLAADARAYLETATSMPSFAARRADLEAWLPVFGNRDRLDITLQELEAQMDAWKAGGAAGSTLNHRVTALRAVYELFNGEDDPNPAAKLARHAGADLEPRAISADIIDEILDTMPRSKTRAMLKVMAATGIPFERQRKLKHLHVQLEQSRVFLVGRKKGAGTKGRWFPLAARGVAAFQEFLDLEAWGGVKRASIYVSFLRAHAAANRARVEAKRPLLPPYRPYDLRHSFGTWAYQAVGDIRAVAELLDCTMQTALRYTMGAVPTRMQATIDALDGKPNRMVAQAGTDAKGEENDA